MLWLQDLADKSKTITFLTIDGMKQYNNFNDLINQFFTTYKNHFKAIVPGKAYAGKVVCFEKLIVQPLPSRGFVWDNWHQDVPCSFIGPSGMYQRWNLQVRQGYGLLGQHYQGRSMRQRLQVLLIVRSESHNDWGTYRSSRVMLNTEELTTSLRRLGTELDFDLVVQDMAKIASYRGQVELVANTSIIIGIHGAGMTHGVHMSVGSKLCCGMLEIFPQGEFFPVKGIANIMRKTGVHYSRVDIDKQNSLAEGARVPVPETIKTLRSLVAKVRSQPSCVLRSVVKNPYLH